MDEEPVGFLGGAVDPYADPDDDSGADPYGSDADPYGSGGDDGEVVGLLGGAQAEEELPALPAADDGTYSASDFMESGEDAYADPYADPYADQGEYEDPYALPPSGGSDYDDYEGYDDGAVAESDPSYFDSMGHDDYDAGVDVATRTADGDDYDDGSPKTISQQDAESIIRRITTKRILPPDQESKPSQPRQLTPSGGGLRIWPILAVVLILGAGSIYVFRESIAKAVPALAPYLGVELEKPPEVDVIKTEAPEVVLKRKMLHKVLASELKAFGIEAKDLAPAPKVETPSDGGAPDEPKTPEEGGGS